MLQRLRVAAIAVVALGALVPRPTAAAPLNPVPAVGVQFHAMWSDYTDAQRMKVLDKLAAAGAGWVRIDMGWSSFQEHGPGRYSRWYVDLADHVVNQARARGLKVLVTIWRTPRWANDGAGVYRPPTHAGDFGDFAAWAAKHFEGRVAAWEIWNEPNHPSYFKGSAADYMPLLRSAYRNIKRVSPGAEVVLGAPVYNDTDWLKKIYEKGGADYFDIMATHPYQGRGDAPPEYPGDGEVWWLTHVEAVRDLMKRYGDADKDVWFTEFGWSAHDNWSGIPDWMRGVTKEQQADYLIRTLNFVGLNYPYVTNVFWYGERNQSTGEIHLDRYGLLKRDLSAKPVYRALKAFLTL